MKAKLRFPLLLAAGMIAGCSNEEETLVSQPTVAAKPQGIQFGAPAGRGGSISLAPANPPANDAAVPAGQALVRDAEEADALVDYSEKVYIHWNEALKQFRAKHGRLPVSLSELQQHEARLAAFPAPKSFALHLDPQLAEINVVRPASTR
jgi:hypothetical protein